MFKRFILVFKGIVVCLLLSAMLFSGSAAKPGLKADTEAALKQYERNKAASLTTVTTGDGKVLYNGGKFTDDRTLLASTLHLLGNKDDGIVQSVLATYRGNAITKNKKAHRYFQKNDLTLTVDSRLQKAAYRLLTTHPKASKEACIIVLDYKTGELKALVSTPKNVLINKAFNAYTPGSVFKAVSAAAVLEKNRKAAADFRYTCTGRDGYVKCMYPHGTVDFNKMLAKSCNCAVARFTEQSLSAAELGAFAKGVGLFNKNQLADLTCRMSGNFNAEAEPRWIPNGQGQTMVTPVAMACFYAALAQGGRSVTPHVLSGTKTVEKQLFSKKTATTVATALEGVIGVSELDCKAFAKTGTAQQGAGIASHGWYCCSLTDKKAPPYTVVVFLQNGGSSVNAKDVAVEYINNTILKR